jgi:hypothetical protein
MQKALKNMQKKFRGGLFPAEENFYAIKEEELEKLLGGGNWKVDRVVYETDQGFPTNHSVTPETVTKKKVIEDERLIYINLAINPESSH